MKRAANLFEQIVERDNLRLGFHKALRGKRRRADACQFARRLDKNLDEMACLLRAGSYPVGRYHQFIIHDPKERIITAPVFAERVLHHSIMNVCEPFFDRWLIDDTYACRAGRGRIAALQRAQEFAGRYSFFLKLDIRKYFDSIPHCRLRALLGRRFKDVRLLELLGRVIGSYRGALGRGIPIGSLTSQYFANFYLGRFDRLVKERLRISGYVRYMDDMALWANSASDLMLALTAGTAFLRDDLHLELKASPYSNRTKHGMEFLGCRVFRHHTTLSRRSRRRFCRKIAGLERAFHAGNIDSRELQQRATAVTAFTRTAGISSWRFRTGVLEQLAVSGLRLEPGDPGR